MISFLIVALLRYDVQLYRKFHPPFLPITPTTLLTRLDQGNEQWVEALEHDFHKEFLAAETLPWVTIESGRLAGTVRSAGGDGNTAGNVTFVAVHEAGSVFSPWYIL
jgi:hypothetical protein